MASVTILRAQFLKVVSQLTMFEHIVEAAAGPNIGYVKVGPFSADDRKRFAAIPAALSEIGLDTSRGHAEESARYIETDEEVEANHLKMLAYALKWSIIRELQARVSLIIPKNRTDLYKKKGTFLGEATLIKFKDLRNDAEEAGNCFALGRYTACVFHLMRIMEKMVHRLGRKPQIKIKDLWKLTWGQILNHLEPNIKKMPRDTPRRQKQKDNYHNCYALLVAVNRSVRIPNAHGNIGNINPTYTEEQAKDVMDRVERFIKEFPTLG